MAIDPIFERAFSRLYGKPCWGVKNCVGSDISFEFERPHLEIRELATASPNASLRVRKFLATRDVYVHGEWNLLIWMCGLFFLAESMITSFSPLIPTGAKSEGAP